MIKLIDAFFLTRPLLLIPVWGFSVFGFYRGLLSQGHKWNYGFRFDRQTLIFFLWMAVFSLSVASFYVLNQIADVEVDKENKGLPLLAKGKVGIKTAWACAIVCAAVSVIAPLYHHPVLSVCSVSALLTGIVYSFRPFYFSGRCFLDFISNAAGYGIIAFGAGWYFSGAHFAGFTFAESAIPYFLLMCAGSISSTLPDYDGDGKCGKKTTAVTIGRCASHIMAMFILASAVLISIMLKDHVAFICAACTFPFYIVYLLRPKEIFMETTYKAGGALCMSVACVIMPLIAVAACLTALSTWIYFKLRYNVNYPSLVPSTEGGREK